MQEQQSQYQSQYVASSSSNSSGAPELITDLVMENSRLADEVANLRKMLSDQVLNIHAVEVWLLRSSVCILTACCHLPAAGASNGQYNQHWTPHRDLQ